MQGKERWRCGVGCSGKLRDTRLTQISQRQKLCQLAQWSRVRRARFRSISDVAEAASSRAEAEVLFAARESGTPPPKHKRAPGEQRGTVANAAARRPGTIAREDCSTSWSNCDLQQALAGWYAG